MKIPSPITKKIVEAIDTHLVAINASNVAEQVRPVLLEEATAEAERVLIDAECAAEIEALKVVRKMTFNRAWKIYGTWGKARREAEIAKLSAQVTAPKETPKASGISGGQGVTPRV